MSLEITRGDNRTILATVYTDETKTVRKNLTGLVAAKFTARRTSQSGTSVFAKTLAGGTIAVTNAAQGLMEITLAPTDTSALPARDTTLYYDLELTFPGPIVTTVDIDRMIVRADVSYT